MKTLKEKIKTAFLKIKNSIGNLKFRKPNFGNFNNFGFKSLKLKNLNFKNPSFKQKLICGGALTAIAVVAVVIGITATPLDMNKDLVVCSNGQVIERPWQITVDGKPIAVLESKKDGETVTAGLLDGYKNATSDATAKDGKAKAATKKGIGIKEKTTLDVEFKEDVAVVKSDMKSGDVKPDFMTVEQSKEKLLKGDNGKPYVTVVAVEKVVAVKLINGKKKIKKTDALYVGQKKVRVKGHKGRQLITYKLIKENGKTIKTKVIARKVLVKSKTGVVLTGTKKRDGVYTASRGGSRNSGINLSSPLSGYGISSGFGYRWGAMHYGLDMTSGYGAPIHAAGGGTVISAGYSGSYGNIVKISHGNGVETYYAHCSSISVSAGQRVSRGQTIAAMGATGNATGPHLHFEVRINGTAVNPASYI